MTTELKLRNTRLSGMGAKSRLIGDLSTTFGSAAVSPNKITTTAASGTQIQWTDDAGGTSTWQWISGRVPAGGFTLTSLTAIDIWAAESMATANCGGRIRLFKLSPNGTETELAGGPFDDGVEFGTSLTQMSWTANPTDTAFAENDRLMLKVYVTNIGTMAAGFTCDLSFDAATGTTGDSLITVNETVAFKAEDNFTGHVAILHCDGTDTSTTFTDSCNRAKTFTANGNAQLDTAQQKFGTASILFDGTGDFIRAPFNQDFAALTGNYTVDFWVRFNAINTTQGLFTFAPSAESGGIGSAIAYPGIFVNSSNKLIFDSNAADRITGTTSVATGQWYHVAWTKSGNDHRLFLNGTQEGSTYTTTDSMLCDILGVVFGCRNFPSTPSSGLNGWLDEIHCERGVAEWTANFTPPTVPWAETVPSSLVWYPTYFNPLIVR